LIKYYEAKYATSILFYQNSLKIRQRTLTSQHPDVADCYNVDEYLKALSYFDRALDIQQHSLSPNHPDLKSASKSIEIVKKEKFLK